MENFRVKKFIASILVVAFVAPICFLSPAKVSAQSAIPAVGIGCLANLGSTLVVSALNSLVTVPVSDSQQLNATFRESCIKPFERAVTQQLLQKITQETTKWVNTGFEGNPFYLRDTQSYSKSLADEQVRDFVSELKLNSNDPDANPFDRDIAKGIVGGYLGTSQTNKFNLNQTIGPDWKKFNNDFSAGGWEGWLAMTQLPQNNAIGSSLQKNDELAAKINAKQTTANNELVQNNGFLSMKKCVEKKPTGFIGPVEPDDQVTFSMLGYDPTGESNDCLRYETVTPGSIIQSQLDRSIGTGQKQLEAGQDLNSGITAVFTSLFTELYNGGVQSVGGSNGPSGSGSNIAVYGGYGNNTLQNNINPVNGGGSTGLGNGSTHWFEVNPDFDIKDPNQLQLVIDTQQKLIDAIKLEILAIFNPANNSGFIPYIHQADFCIPGPHPGWEQEATLRMNKKIQEVSNQDEEGWSDAEKEQDHAKKLVQWIGFPASSSDINIRSKDKVPYLLDRALNGGDDITNTYQLTGYTQKIYLRYNNGPGSLPPSSQPIFNLYSNLAAYEEMIRTTPDPSTGKRGSLQERISLAEGNKALLTKMKADIIQANLDLKNGSITQTAYDNLIATKKSTFSNIASTLATDTQVESVNADTSRIKDQTETLSSPTGLIHQCEDEVSSGLYRTERMPYKGVRPPNATNYPITTVSTGFGVGTAPTFLPHYIYGFVTPFLYPDNPAIPGEDYEIHMTDAAAMQGNSPTIWVLEYTIGIY